MKCPNEECGSTNVRKHGAYRNKTGFYQRYKCQNCGSTFRSEETIEEASLRISDEK